MSKTFKSASGRSTLTIGQLENGVIFRVSDSRGFNHGMISPPEEAAKQALAILEAAGVEVRGTPVDPTHWDDPEELKSLGAWCLQRAGELTEARAAAAREQAELEDEALELYQLWETCESDDETVWLAVARRAREIAKEATK